MTSTHDIKLYVENLISLYKNADDDKDRIYYMKEFGDLRVASNRVFTFLKGCLVSDTSFLVRIEAAKSLILAFGEKSKESIIRAVQYEESDYFFNNILELTNDINGTFVDEIKSNIFKRFVGFFQCHEDDARILWEISNLVFYRLCKVNTDDAGGSDGTDKYCYRLNADGHVIGLYIWDMFSNLKIFPEQICKLKHLEVLYLTGNTNIKEIPPCITKLKNLRVLYLRANEIENIPQAITQLKDLRELDLFCNNIRHIDESIRPFLEQLEKCEIFSNWQKTNY